MATVTAKRGRGIDAKATPLPPKKKAKRAKKGQGKKPEAQATFFSEVKAESPNITSDQLAERFKMPLDETARMRGFLHEYVKDYDEKNAALRMGYPEASASSTGKLLLGHSYSQLKLSELQAVADVDAVCTAAQLHAALWKEANRPDTVRDGCVMTNSSTRISAMKTLLQAKGLLNPKPKEEETQIRRVMFVGTLIDNWENQALESQRALKASTAIDV